MARKKIPYDHPYPYHIYNQVNNREPFWLPLHRVWDIFSEAIAVCKRLYRFKMHTIVLMPNHYHLLASFPEAPIHEVMKRLVEEVTRKHNQQAKRVGHLFRGSYKACLVPAPSTYPHVTRYVLRNPVRAGLCDRVQDWPFTADQSLCLSRSIETDDPILHEFKLHHHLGSQPPLAWANAPTRKEDLERIRKAIMRTEFKLPKDRSTRAMRPLEQVSPEAA